MTSPYHSEFDFHLINKQTCIKLGTPTCCVSCQCKSGFFFIYHFKIRNYNSCILDMPYHFKTQQQKTTTIPFQLLYTKNEGCVIISIHEYFLYLSGEWCGFSPWTNILQQSPQRYLITSGDHHCLDQKHQPTSKYISILSKTHAPLL